MNTEDVLAFERSWLGADRTTGHYERAIRETFGLSATAYALQLTKIVDSPEAMAIDPVTARLVRARRAAGMKQRRPA